MPKLKSTIIPAGSAKPKSAKSTHYVDNEKLFTELCTYLDKRNEAEAMGAKLPKIPNYLGECMMQIAKRMGTMHYFRNYSYIDEMIDTAVENCIRKLHKFNPQITQNPFAYFTQICYYAFIGVISNEKEEAAIRYKSLLNALSDTDMMRHLGAEASEDAKHVHDNISLDIGYMEDAVAAFETKNKITGMQVSKRGRKKVVDQGVFE